MRTTTRIVFLLVVFGSVAGCNDYTQADFAPMVSDKANILAETTRQRLLAQQFPKGFFLVVETHVKLDRLTLGAFADRRFDELTESLGEAFERRGVLLLASTDPRLVQVRAGHEFYRQSQWAGLTAGPEHVKRQLIAETAGLDRSLIVIAQHLARELPSVERIPWYKKWILQDTVQVLYMELEDLSLPSEGFYWAFLLKPITSLRVAETRLLGTWWLTFIAVSLIAYGLAFGSQKLLSLAFYGSRRSRKLQRALSIAGGVSSFAIILFLAMPSAASAILLSGSRVEDRIALAAAKIPGIESVSFDPAFSGEGTAILIACLLGFLRVLKGFASRASISGLAFLPPEQQQLRYRFVSDRDPFYGMVLKLAGQGSDGDEDSFNKEPYTWAYWRPGLSDLGAGLRWGLLAWLFLPLSLSLAAVYFWIVPIALGAWKTAQSLKSHGVSRPACPSPASG